MLPRIVGKDDFIPENMFYRLVWKSRDERALEFQAKVADEILPTIRRTGTYSIQPRTTTPLTDKIVDIGETARALEKYITGLKSGMSLAQAIALAEANDDAFNYEPIKALLPAAEHETGYLNATQIGEKLGLGAGQRAARRTNKLLKEMGYNYWESNGWRLTEEGTLFGEEVPYSRNGHNGYQIRWSDGVVNALKEYIIAEGAL